MLCKVILPLVLNFLCLSFILFYLFHYIMSISLCIFVMSIINDVRVMKKIVLLILHMLLLRF
jgi:hypothetical protein